MHARTNHLLRLLAFLAALGSGACGPVDESSNGGGGGGGTQAPFPAGAGIQQNVSLSALQRGGWSVCYEDTYATFGPTVASILGTCTGKYLMLACRSGTTTDLLPLGAADLATVVTQADAATATAHHVANGVGWYFTDQFSWGFFPATEAVNRAPCDFDAGGTQTQKEKRLCWELSSGGGELKEGYRCGANVDLRASASWRRLVLSHP